MPVIENLDLRKFRSQTLCCIHNLISSFKQLSELFFVFGLWCSLVLQTTYTQRKMYKDKGPPDLPDSQDGTNTVS